VGLLLHVYIYTLVIYYYICILVIFHLILKMTTQIAQRLKEVFKSDIISAWQEKSRLVWVGCDKDTFRKSELLFVLINISNELLTECLEVISLPQSNSHRF